MRALHLPGLTADNEPPFAYPSRTPPPSALVYTHSDYPAAADLRSCPTLSHSARAYRIRVSHTALTRGELAWEETLRASRFSAHGGAIPGHDLVGTITEILPLHHRSGVEEEEGAVVREGEEKGERFKVGDKVAALLAFDRDGAAAGYTLAEAGELARAPDGVADYELATIPLSGLSAWQALFEHGGLEERRLDDSHPSAGRGQNARVLVTGASGSVGVMAVQLAKAAGCWVFGTCSSRNIAFVADELGADEVLDYRKVSSLAQGFQEQGIEPVDVVVDTVGGKTLAETMDTRVVQDGARVVSLAMPLKAAGPCAEEAGRAFEARGGKFAFFVVRPDGEQLSKLLELVRIRRVRGFVDQVVDLSHGAEAMEKVKSGRCRGKVVLEVDPHS